MGIILQIFFKIHIEYKKNFNSYSLHEIVDFYKECLNLSVIILR